jgi:hypothetical protein
MSVASPALRDAIIQAMGRAEQNGRRARIKEQTKISANV